MTGVEIRRWIAEENPAARPADAEMYAQQFATYFEAAINLEQNGAIVAHPRTGQPMENPYLRVRASAQVAMCKLRRLSVNRLWAVAAVELAGAAVQKS